MSHLSETKPAHVCNIDIDRFMQLARLRYPSVPYVDADPLQAILRRLVLHPGTPISLALRKASLAVLADAGTLTSEDLWRLDANAISLLDHLAEWQEAGRYRAGVLRAAATLLGEA